MYFLEKTCHYSAGTADGFSFHILKFQGYLGKKKPLCTLSPNPNILLAWKINSRPIVCIHLLPTRKSSLSCIARGGGEVTSRQVEDEQRRPKKASPIKAWFSQSITGVTLFAVTERERERDPAYETVGSVQEIQYDASCSPYGHMSDSSGSPSHNKPLYKLSIDTASEWTWLCHVHTNTKKKN